MPKARLKAIKGNARKRAEPAADIQAVSYTPTERERVSLEKQQARRAARVIHSTMTAGPNLDGRVEVAVNHPDPVTGELLLMESLGTSNPHVASFIVEQIGFLAQVKGEVSANVLNRHLAIVQDIAPQDTVEAMLACQMTAVHLATMAAAFNLYKAKDPEAFTGQLNKLGRTFTTQVEALKRYRSKGDQKVTVEHKHYHLSPGAIGPGSQAVLGDVTQQGGGVPLQTEAIPHVRSLPECGPMHGQVETNGAAVPWPGSEGLEGVSLPWGSGRPTSGAGS